MANKGKYGKWNHTVGDRQVAVIEIHDPTTATPADPTTGDRYIAGATANGWTINNIYQWNGAAWVETARADNMQVFVQNRSADYWFDGANWVVITGPLKRGRNAYLANTPSPRAAEWNGTAENQHTVRCGREAWANPRPGEEPASSSSMALESSSILAISSSSLLAISSSSSSSLLAISSSSSSSAGP